MSAKLFVGHVLLLPHLQYTRSHLVKEYFSLDSVITLLSYLSYSCIAHSFLALSIHSLEVCRQEILSDAWITSDMDIILSRVRSFRD